MQCRRRFSTSSWRIVPIGDRKMMTQIVQSEEDIWDAVYKIKYLLKGLPFSEKDTQCVIVSLLEIAHNVLDHGGGMGTVICKRVDGGICFIVSDQGPGIPCVDTILKGQYTSHSGLGLGLNGAKRLMDELKIETSTKGTRIIAIKRYV